ncbi:hypothetical protein WCU66_08260 [Dickeya dianthicola]|nr:hypothetical protein [Dickeya dianthicola]
MQIIGFVIYFAIGLVQLFATMAGLESWWGLHWIIAGPVAFILAYIPLVGSIVGMVGAVDVWGWGWWQAGALFFGGLILTFTFGSIATLIDWFSSRNLRGQGQ